MGTVVQFRHVRASIEGDPLACSLTRRSAVISLAPLLRASSTISSQRSAGIESRAAVRQELTVERLSPSASATALVPPSASIMSSTDPTITSIIVRSVRTSQVFADREGIFSRVCDPIPAMAEQIKAIAKRLVRTREALGLTQAEFCIQIGVEKNIYNPFEKGRRRITIDVALKIRDRFGVSLDWIYCGQVAALPVDLFNKLAAAA